MTASWIAGLIFAKSESGMRTNEAEHFEVFMLRKMRTLAPHIPQLLANLDLSSGFNCVLFFSLGEPHRSPVVLIVTDILKKKRKREMLCHSFIV